MASIQWRNIVAEKRLRQQSTIPQEWILSNPPSKETLNVIKIPEQCGLLSELEIQITNSDVETLLENLAKGVWTAVAVTTAFSKRAIIAHQLVNCLTEIFVDRALARAAELDEHLEKTGKVIGPLHGLPISLKDQINIKGIESTMGYVAWIGKYASKNSVLADVLEAAGAVLYVKTNIPQTLMWPETFNYVFGRTSNPYNRSLTSGGSSGGEGALVALKGSPIGVGSDIGGSIRIPSGFNGLYGLRPSYGRVPYAGCVNSLEGQDSVPSVLGPLSNGLSGVKQFMKSVIDKSPWLNDPLCVRKHWNEAEYGLVDHGKGEKLCFGILWDDGVSVPHPPVIRGLEEVKKSLIAAGHKVIDWKPFKHLEIYENVQAIWGAGNVEDYEVALASSGEPLITNMTLLQDDPNIDPNTIEPAPIFSDREPVSAFHLWQVQKRRRDLREEYLEHWNATASETGTGRPVDAIVSPMAAYTAPPHGMNRSANYTMIWNALDYTALVIPTGLHVDERIDAKKPPHQFYGELDETNYDMYDPKVFKNAPITFQIVGRTLEEEAVIAIGEIVDAAIKNHRGSELQVWLEVTGVSY